MYVILEPTGSYFKDIHSNGWSLTDKLEEADKFDDLKECESTIGKLNSLVVTTYWDWNDIIPYPKLRKVEEL